MHCKALLSELQGSPKPASFPLCYEFGNEKFSNREIFSPSRWRKEFLKYKHSLSSRSGTLVLLKVPLCMRPEWLI